MNHNKNINLQNSGKINLVIVELMIDAIRICKGKSQEEILKLVFEIISQCLVDFQNDRKVYKISPVQNRNFTGQEILAYLYVFWKYGIPERIDEIFVDFSNEYNYAEKKFNLI